MSLLLNFYLILPLILVGKSELIDENLYGEPIFVSSYSRHGDRTPYYFYPNDPYKNASFWPEGVGQLTNEGKKQEFELGQWLRSRYDALLTESYSPDIVYVQSTDVDRTLMSAQCLLAGMYPPKGAQVWNDHLEWQPIPVHTVPGEMDNFFTGFAHCPAFDEEEKNIQNSKGIQELNEKYAEVYKVLNENTGEVKNGLSYILDIYSTLYVENLKGLPLPEWTNTIFPHPMDEAAFWSFTLQTRTKKLARFKAGLMIQNIIDNMDGKRKGNSLNFHVNSVHEHTIATIMNALGIFYLHDPPYAACLMVELRVTPSEEHVVTIHYRNSTLEEPFLLTIPGCSPACPLDQFISITQPLAIEPEEWDKECGRNT